MSKLLSMVSGATARRTTQNPAEANGTGGARGASRLGSASTATIHAPFEKEVECKIAPVCRPAALRSTANLGRSCKSVSRSSCANGLRRRTYAYLRRNCHAKPIGWLADGFGSSSPICPAMQSVSNASHMKVEEGRAVRLSAINDAPGCSSRRTADRSLLETGHGALMVDLQTGAEGRPR